MPAKKNIYSRTLGFLALPVLFKVASTLLKVDLLQRQHALTLSTHWKQCAECSAQLGRRVALLK